MPARLVWNGKKEISFRVLAIPACEFGPAGFTRDASASVQDLIPILIHASNFRQSRSTKCRAVRFSRRVIRSSHWKYFIVCCRKLSTRAMLLSSLIVGLPALGWMYVYSDQSFRKLWPKHCQTALYPSFAKAIWCRCSDQKPESVTLAWIQFMHRL